MSIRTLIAVFSVLMLPVTGLAAEFSFEPVQDAPSPGFTVQIVLGIDRDVNAFEGVIQYDEEVVAVAQIREGAGAVPLWVERPNVTDPGALSFAGVFPGGLQRNVRDHITLFEVVFEALVPGTTTLTIEESSVYLHGPDGDLDNVRAIPLIVTVDNDDIGTPDVGVDKIPPESFDVAIVRDVPVGERSTVAVFSTRDFQSSVAEFAIRERFLGLFGSWHTTESPAVLSIRWPFSIIDVRATDYAGNSRVEHATPRSLPLLVIVLAGGALAIWYRRRA